MGWYQRRVHGYQRRVHGEFATGMFQNLAQMLKNTSETFLMILNYKYSEGKEDDEEKESQDSGEAQNGCGLGDDDGEGGQATTNDVESEDIFDSAEKPQNQVRTCTTNTGSPIA